jgi:ketosteroid isomerase-like protein
MSEQTDVLKKGYEAYGTGDLETVMENWQDDVRWEGSNSSRVPGHGTHEGKQAIAGVLQETAAAYDEFSVHPDEFLEDGETVVVLGHSHIGKGGRKEQVPFVHVFRFDEGKVERIQILTDTAVAAEVLEG